MVSLSPYEKAIRAFQAEYAENISIELGISKAEFNDFLYKHVSKVIPLVTTARRRMEEKGMLIYPKSGEKCILVISKIKAENF